jgi:predicted permease
MRSFRSLWRAPGFTIPAVLCLGLGIAASTVMAGVLDALLLRAPAHVEEVDTVHRVAFEETYPGAGTITSTRTSFPIYEDLASTEGLESAAVFQARQLSIGEDREAREISAVLASRSFFDTLGVTLEIGRWFDADETTPGSGTSVIVLGHETWRDRFGGNRSVLGQSVRIADRPYEIIGVAPRGFTGADMARVDVWLPLASLDHLMGPGWEQSRGSRFLVMVARRAPGVSAVPVEAEMTATLQAQAPYGGIDTDPRVALEPLLSFRGSGAGSGAGSDVRVSFWLTGVALIVLLLAIVNVTNLQLTRLLLRSKEIAVRMALGARRASLVGALTAESLWLALGGCLVAVPLVIWGGRFLRRVFLADLIGLDDGLDSRLMVALMASAVIAALLIVVIPALFAARRDPATALPTGVEVSPPDRRSVRQLLLVGQVALTFVLLVGAGVFLRSLANAQSVDLGMDLDQILVASIDPRELSSETAWGVEELYRRGRDRLAQMAGVESVAITAALPLQTSFAQTLEIPGVPNLSEVLTDGPYIHVVSPEYFETLGMEIVEGRGFDVTEGRRDGERVVVVNRQMADLVWPEGSPLDRCVRIGGAEAPCGRVVGVVDNAQRSATLATEPSVQYYVPLGQGPGWMKPTALLVRTRDDPGDLVGPVRSEIQSLASHLPFVRVRPLEQAMDRTLRPWRLGSALLGVFGLVALAIAAFGTYGVVAYNVARRQYEMGVRLALGAERSSILRSVLFHGLKVGLLGIVLGIGASLLAGQTIEALLYGVTPTDHWAMALASLVLLGVVVGATLGPAVRASRVDPVESLRVD